MVRGPIIGAVVLGVVLATTSFTAAPPLEELNARYETASNFDDEAGGDADADDPPSGCTPPAPATASWWGRSRTAA